MRNARIVINIDLCSVRFYKTIQKEYKNQRDEKTEEGKKPGKKNLEMQHTPSTHTQ